MLVVAEPAKTAKASVHGDRKTSCQADAQATTGMGAELARFGTG
jgi:hypothetical protein